MINFLFIKILYKSIYNIYIYSISKLECIIILFIFALLNFYLFIHKLLILFLFFLRNNYIDKQHIYKMKN